MKRAVITRADDHSQAAAEGTPWAVLIGTPTLRPGSAPMLLRVAATGVHARWSWHPTHAEAIAYAWEQTHPIQSWHHSRKGQITGRAIWERDPWVGILLDGDHHLHYSAEENRGSLHRDGDVLVVRKTLLAEVALTTPPEHREAP